MRTIRLRMQKHIIYARHACMGLMIWAHVSSCNCGRVGRVGRAASRTVSGYRLTPRGVLDLDLGPAGRQPLAVGALCLRVTHRRPSLRRSQHPCACLTLQTMHLLSLSNVTWEDPFLPCWARDRAHHAWIGFMMQDAERARPRDRQ